MKKSASLPLEPLWKLAAASADLHAIDDVTGGFTQTLFAEMVRTTDRTVSRWMQDGELPWTAADEAAVALGLHPSLVWGDDWWNVKGDFDALAQSIESELEMELADHLSAEGMFF